MRENRNEKIDHYRAYEKKWIAENKGKWRAIQAAHARLRSELKGRSVLGGLTIDDFRPFYDEAVRREEETSTKQHVDHVIAIKGRCLKLGKHVVCGLHVPWNLSVEVWIDNQQKWCWFDSDKAAEEQMKWLSKRGLTTHVVS